MTSVKTKTIWRCQTVDAWRRAVLKRSSLRNLKRNLKRRLLATSNFDKHKLVCARFKCSHQPSCV